MSRLGDLIRTERLRQKMTPKQVAKKCGVAESYLLDVEAGKRIIGDDQARRILKTIGLRQQNEADFTLDDIAATVDLQTVQPRMAAQAAKPKVKPAVRPEAEPAASEGDGIGGSIWLDALTSVLRRVPVYNAVMKEVDHRLLPILNGRIEGANPEKVYYFLAPDDSMRGFRICSQDVVLVVPAASPVDGAVMLAEYGSHRALRKVKKLDGFQVLLQSFDREYNAETCPINEVNFLGRCVRVEIEL